MCSCKNVEAGTYDNQVMLIAPVWYKPSEPESLFVCVDTCIAQEIVQLWSAGIITYGCCCGHNRQESFVNVDEKYIETMLEMGYIMNHPDESRKDTFRLKSAG